MEQSKKTIGVDFGATTIKIGVVLGARILDKTAPLPTQQFTDPTAIMDAMCASIRDLQTRHPEVVAVGLGMPGCPQGAAYLGQLQCLLL